MEQTSNNESSKQNGTTVLLAVSFDDVNNCYNINLAKGSNVAETAFAMTVVIKCLLKDGIIENAKDVTDLIDKYLNDPQYEEVTEHEETV